MWILVVVVVVVVVVVAVVVGGKRTKWRPRGGGLMKSRFTPDGEDHAWPMGSR